MTKKSVKSIDGLTAPSAPRSRASQAARLRAAEQAARREGRLVSATGNSNVRQATTVAAATAPQPSVRRPKLRSEIASEFAQPVEALGNFDMEIKEDYSSKKALRQQKKSAKGQKKLKKPWSKKRKVITGVLVTLLIILVAGGAVFAIWGNDIIAKITGGKSNLFELVSTMVSEKYTPLQAGPDGRTNILAIGTSGYDMGGSEHDGAQLTDSIMIISIDQETKDLAMVNLPRDLYMGPGGTCTATGKINEIYWCNNQDEAHEEEGITALEETIEKLLGIDIQYHVHVNWGALVSLVDSIGGITVTLDEDIADDWTNTYITAGEPVTLDGEQALGLARARHGTENGDFSRGTSQQKIIIALVQKMMDGGIGLSEAMNLLSVLGDNLRTNFSLDEIKTAAHLAREASLDSLRQIPLVALPDGTYYVTTADIGGISYVVPAAGTYDYSQIQKYLRQQFSNDPLVREGASIAVLNGTDAVGVASAEAAKLEELGLSIGLISDAPAGEYPEHYYLYNISESTPATLKLLEERYGVVAAGREALPYGIWADAYDVVVIIGEDNAAVDAATAE